MSYKTSPAKALFRHLHDTLYDRYGPPSWAKYPEGLQLEMHPSVRYAILSDPSMLESPNFMFQDVSEYVSLRLRLPLKYNPDLPKDGWRLVIVTEDVLTGGTLPRT